MAQDERGWTGGPTKKPRPIPTLSDKDIDRFWSMVERRQPGECWPWQGGFDNGYAVFNLNYTAYRASRVMWVLTFDTDPAPLLICHHCDNPPCVNPGHLFIGTAKDNNDDKKRKGRESPLAAEGLKRRTEQQRAQTHCKQGHPFSGENTYSAPSSPNVRRCKTCQSLANARYDARRERVRVNAREYQAMREQLVRLRQLGREARDVLALLVPFGKIHTVEGVRYPDGTHSEAVDRGERVLNELRSVIGKEWESESAELAQRKQEGSNAG